MKITYFIRALDLAGESQQSIVTQANQLSERHDVCIISIFKTAQKPFYPVSARIRVIYLIGGAADSIRILTREDLTDTRRRDMLATPSLMVQGTPGFSLLTDVAVDDALRQCDADVLLTTSPVLLSLAIQVAPARLRIVHQEHKMSQLDPRATNLLLSSARLADLVTVVNHTDAAQLRAALGSSTPPIEVVPHPIMPGYRPTSLLNSQTIMASGPLVPGNGFTELVRAFALISDRIPGWRVRIFGKGPRRRTLEVVSRRLKLFDRIEFAGTSPDMPGEWAKASIAALTVRADSMPLAALSAMAAGVPVVSFDAPTGPREFVVHEENGLLVAPGSVPGLASALLRLAEDDYLRRGLAANALAHSQRFAVEPIAQRIEALLTEMDQHALQSAQASRIVRRTAALPAGTQASSTRPIDLTRQRLSQPDAPPSEKPTALTVSQARTVALRWAVAAAERVADTWFVIPAESVEEPPTLVVPAARRTQYLGALGERDAPPDLVIHDQGGQGWLESSGPPARILPQLVRGKSCRLGLQLADAGRLYGDSSRIGVEFWECVNDTLIAPAPNAYVGEFRPTEMLISATIEGVKVKTLPLMAEISVLDSEFPVDVVYTWVDGSDPNWLARREARMAEIRGYVPRVEARGAGRYTSRDELKYSMRSLSMFAPWVRHIYIVTDRQTPSWLDTTHPSVTVVDHTEILSSDVLPTFNSHAIETSLHKIDGLSEQFIYFNDDVFLGRPVGKHRFFSPSGQPSAFFSPVPIGASDPEKKPHLLAAYNNRDLLRRDFSRTITKMLYHTPHPLARSVMMELEERYASEFRRTAAAPFRSPTDIAAVASLAQHYTVITGQGTVGQLTSKLVPLNTADLEEVFIRLAAHRDTDSFCLSDYHEYVLSASKVTRLVANFFEDYFPVAAPWERPGV